MKAILDLINLKTAMIAAALALLTAILGVLVANRNDAQKAAALAEQQEREFKERMLGKAYMERHDRKKEAKKKKGD